jgi:hypothetical protein
MATYIDGMEGGKHNSDETECRSPKTFEIKITGEGQRKHIIHALYDVIRSLESTDENELDGSEWEDPVLMTEVNEI